MAAGWQPKDFASAATRVEFENTNFLGSGKILCPLHGSRRRPDVRRLRPQPLLSGHRCLRLPRQAQGASHRRRHALHEELLRHHALHHLQPTGPGRRAQHRTQRLPRAMHTGSRLPPKSAPPLVDTTNSKDPGYRVPRITADLVAARPIHLAVIDGIYTMTGGELPNQDHGWIHQPVHPGLLIAGMNCVSTDAVATAVMGFDPMADRGTPPFETADSTLRLAEQSGRWQPRPQPHRSPRHTHRQSPIRFPPLSDLLGS